MFSICRECGGRFEDRTKNHNKMFCSGRCYHRNWNIKNREKRKEITKKYREKNRERMRGRTYRWATKNRKRNAKYQRERRLNNPEHTRNIERKYTKTLKGKLNTLKKGANRRFYNHKSYISPQLFKTILNRDKCCVYCGSKTHLTYDHIVPVSLGGTTTYDNLVIACANCNSAKHKNPVEQFCREKGVEIPFIIQELMNKQAFQLKLEQFINL